MKKTLISAAIAAALSLSSPLSQAYEAGDILLRVGVTNVSPNDSSGKVYTDFGGLGTTDLEVGVDGDTQVGLNLVYFYDQNWAVEVLAATPFKHGVNLKNDNLGLGNGSLGEVKHLPPTISALYYFNDSNSTFQPYVGVGVNFTTFFEEGFTSSREAQGFSDLSLDDSWGLAAQVGFDYQLNDQWQINASVRYLDIDTTADFKLGGQHSSVDVDIDPVVSSVMIGYKF